MAPSTAINTRTLAVITITVMLATTTQQRDIQVQIVKGLVQQERSVLLEQPPALIVLQGSSASQLASLRVKTAARENTARPLEPQATLHV